MSHASQSRILGIDPGLNTTGYGVIEVHGQTIKLCEAGIIRSRAQDSIENRLQELHNGIKEVIEAFYPERMALEQLFSHYARPRTAILMGHARGVICLAAGQAGIPVSHYEPTRVKKVLTGNGHAPKHQMQQAVKLQLSLATVPEPADVADALAIALCGHHLAGHHPGGKTPLEVQLMESKKGNKISKLE
ncbi:crossover junction endodeoxyribonuclease RuvC [Novipirellula herctigrandis]|uniref:crossover junction endodeoxyribonuclease RuvC n=1 Tax=Novipirellula herctigrandis TaxID=2527986 RepID=UPI003AF3B73C